MNGTRIATSLLLLAVNVMVAPLVLAQSIPPRAAVAPAAPFKAEPAIVVEADVQASKAFADKPHNEIHVAANPRNPLNLVGGAMVWNQETNKMTVVAYSSFDGGKSWAPTLTFKDEYYHSDPTAAFGPDGTAFFLQITNTSGREPKYFTHVYRSKDGGKTWLPPTVLPMYDRHYMAFNRSAGERRNWLFINGSSAGGVKFGRSKDGGLTFDEEPKAMTPPADIYPFTGPILTLSDGKILIPFFLIARDVIGAEPATVAKPNSTLNVVISENGGDSFSAPIKVADTGIGHTLRTNPNHFSSAVDQTDGPFKDRMYIVWSDSYHSGGSGVTSKRVTGSNILLTYTADGGKTWSKPTLINDDATAEAAYTAVHFRPVVTVNREGVVGVMWYDRRDSANGIDYTPRFTASLDGGNTFLPSVKVSEAPFAYSKFRKVVSNARPYGGGQRPLNRAFWGGTLRFDLGVDQFNLAGGHTAGLAADASGRFHPFWVDNRTGVSQIWTAAVTVNAKAVPHGSAELSSLEDLSDSILLELENPRFDLSSGHLIVDATIQNVSADVIKSPLNLRVVIVEATSGGFVKVVNADNGIPGVGAIWNFTEFVVDRQLKPNEKSKVKQLELQVSNAPSLTAERISEGGFRALQLVHLEARLFGKTEKAAQSKTDITKKND